MESLQTYLTLAEKVVPVSKKKQKHNSWEVGCIIQIWQSDNFLNLNELEDGGCKEN